MRNSFIQKLLALAKRNSQIVLIVGDIGYSVVEPFANEFSDRFINAGVAEQNMTGLAAGMASEGYHVFTYSIGNFPTFRCAEQIRNDVAYHELPVTIVSVGGGVGYGSLGYSHHAVQDYALIRTFPNILIAAPGDSEEVNSCMEYLVNHPGPSYLRLSKSDTKVFHATTPIVSPGKWLPIIDKKSKKTIVTTGACLQLATNLILSKEYSDYSVHSLPLWSMHNKKQQIQELIKYEHVVTIEDHLHDGGFGSWLLEARSLDPNVHTKISNKFIHSDVCGTVGSESYLHKLSNL